MITSITIENFKGIGKRVTIPLKPITLLFGPNSAGKSTILHAIQYVADVLHRGNLDAERMASTGEQVDLGGFRNFIHGRRTDRLCRFGFEIEVGLDVLPESVIVRGEDDDDEPPLGAQRTANWLLQSAQSIRVELAIGWSELLQNAYIAEYAVAFNGVELARVANNPGRRSVEITAINFNHPLFKWHWPETDEAEYPWGWPDFSLRADLIKATDKTIEEQIKEHSEEMSELDREYGNPLRYWYAMATGEQPKPADAAFGKSLRIPVLNMSSALPPQGQPLRLSLAAPGDEGASTQADDENESNSPLALEEIFTQALVRPCDLLRKLLLNLVYVGPIRSKPGRDFHSPRFFDPSRWADGLAAWDWLLTATDEQLDEVGGWLARPDRLATGYRLARRKVYQLDAASPLGIMLSTGRVFDDLDDVGAELRKLPSLTRVLLVEEATGMEVEPCEVGEGIAQVVPVVVAVLSSSAQLIAIEQPELHVHPRVQVALGDLLIEWANETDHGPPSSGLNPAGTLLIETHSEHLLLRLLRRIRETAEGKLPELTDGLEPDHLAVLYVEPGEEGTQVKELRVDEAGEFLDPWPQGFFEERGEELFG